MKKQRTRAESAPRLSEVLGTKKGFGFFLNGDREILKMSSCIQLQPALSKKYFQRGRFFYKKEDYLKSLLNYSKVISVTPRFPLAAYFRGQTYVRLKNYKMAIKDFDTAFGQVKENEKKTYEKQHEFQIVYNRAWCYKMIYKWDKAVKDFLFIIREKNKINRVEAKKTANRNVDLNKLNIFEMSAMFNPKSFLSMKKQIHALDELKKKKKSENINTNLLALDESNLLKEIEGLRKKNGEKSTPKKMLKKFRLKKRKNSKKIRRNNYNSTPTFPSEIEDVNLHYEIGLIYMYQGHFEKSIEFFDTAIKIEPDNPIVWFYSAFVNEKLKKFNNALRDYKNCLRSLKIWNKCPDKEAFNEEFTTKVSTSLLKIQFRESVRMSISFTEIVEFEENSRKRNLPNQKFVSSPKEGKKYLNMIEKARKLDLKEFEEEQIIRVIGKDKKNYPFVIFQEKSFGKKQLKFLVYYILLKLEDVANEKFHLFWCVNNKPNKKKKEYRPGLSFMLNAYKSFPKKLKENLQGCYIIHPNIFYKMALKFFHPIIGRKFMKKIYFCKNISEVNKYVSLPFNPFPPWIFLHEISVNDVKAPYNPVFGVSIDEIMSRKENKSRDVPYILEICTKFIEKKIEVEGLFRKVGNSNKLKVLKKVFNYDYNVELHFTDVDTICSLLKLWFRELKDSLFPYNFFDEIINLQSEILSVIELLERIPYYNRRIIKFFFKFLKRCVDNKENKMNSKNISICIAPSIVRSGCTRNKMTLLENAKRSYDFVKFLIDHFDNLFS